ncbi:hypothetical protein ACFOU2_11145 [Bacillus songklensis]|uniref:DUF4314 domain-containing protein n=1 Tax=Bacillus songklensis TaxID=1069116 RepID=A0ABV8B156_9BACI
MNPYRLFQKGEIVQVIDPNNPLYGEVGQIDFITISGRYFVKFAGGNGVSLSPQDIKPSLECKQEKD